MKGFPEQTIGNENDKINRSREDLQNRKIQLEKSMKDARENEIDFRGVETFCKLASENLESFTYEDKRLALEALKIRVVINGDKITVHGSIPKIESNIVSLPPGWNHPRSCRNAHRCSWWWRPSA